MPKGKHKGGRRCFTNFEDLGSKQAKEEKEKAWRKARGEEVNDSEEDGSKEDTESSEESEEEEEGQPKAKAKGTEGLIEIENPNYVVNKAKKVSAIATEEPAATEPQLTRKEKEEVERQKKAANYRKLHAQGKTDEARADLERLALIRKQREEAQKKKEDEKKAKDEATAMKREQVAKALNKKEKGSSR